MAGIVTVRRVDHAAIRVNQSLIIALLIVSFVIGSLWLAAFVAAVMLVGTAFPQLALFQQIYHRVLKPTGLVRTDVISDNPEPHRFAQGLGGGVVTLGVLALAFGATAAGWALIWLVVFLAAANLFLGFCAGCFLYYQLNRLGVPGFDRGPLQRS
jgi:hypothetical protein